jgi:hypothetical protein
MSAKYVSEKKADASTTPMDQTAAKFIKLANNVKRLDSIEPCPLLIEDERHTLCTPREETITFFRKTKSPFIRKTEMLLSKRDTGYEQTSFKQSLQEEQISKELVKKANMLKNHLPGGFVNRRKIQLVGFKLL